MRRMTHIKLDQVGERPPIGTIVMFNTFLQTPIKFDHHRLNDGGTLHAPEEGVDKTFVGERKVSRHNGESDKVFHIEGEAYRRFVRNMVLVKGVDYE